jgi:hypothetical protein
MTERKRSPSQSDVIAEYTLLGDGRRIEVSEFVGHGVHGPIYSARLRESLGQTAMIDARSRAELRELIQTAVDCFGASLELR